MDDEGCEEEAGQVARVFSGERELPADAGGEVWGEELKESPPEVFLQGWSCLWRMTVRR